MSREAVKFYMSFLQSREVSFDIQERVFQKAKSAKSDSLMAALARVPTLAPGLDAKIRDCAGARGLAAWASRPERTVAELESLARSTKSVNVAKSLAELKELPTEVYESLLRFKNPSVAFALVMNPSASKKARLESLPLLAENLPYGKGMKLQAVLSADEDLLKAFVGNGTRVALNALEALVGIPEFPPEIEKFLLDVLRNAMQQEKRRTATVAFNAIAGAASSFDRKLLKEAVELFESGKQSYFYYGLNNVKAALGTPVAPSFRSRIHSASTVEELEKVTAEAMPFMRESLASAVALHPKVTLDILKQVLPGRSWVVAAPLIDHFKGDPLKLGVVLFYNPYYIRDSLLFASGAPERVLSQVLDLTAEKGNAPHREVFSSRFFDGELAKKIPALHVKNSSMPEEALKVIEDLLASTFKGRPDAWETFESLLDSHEGTIGELIDIVAALVELEPQVAPEKKRASKSHSQQDCEPLF